ncbi:MAG: WYL domain-containing protein [Rhodobacteraceae bacterium]|nr:WYL domain-containing protein [Paracoccaceae bacterium]
MSRSHRLMQLMQLFRSLPPPVRAQSLADETGVSLRSLYRDIEALRSMGAVIDGAAGYGYTLIDDPALPPMSFSQDEIEALVLGLREVQAVADSVLSKAAQNALAKLRASLPESQRHQLEHASLHARRFHQRPEIIIDIAKLRGCIRAETVIHIHYNDQHNAPSERDVYPLGIVFLESTLVLASWCCLRQDFRTFRLDRIVRFTETRQSFRPKRVPLLREIFAKFKAEREAAGEHGRACTARANEGGL